MSRVQRLQREPPYKLEYGKLKPPMQAGTHVKGHAGLDAKAKTAPHAKVLKFSDIKVPGSRTKPEKTEKPDVPKVPEIPAAGLPAFADAVLNNMIVLHDSYATHGITPGLKEFNMFPELLFTLMSGDHERSKWDCDTYSTADTRAAADNEGWYENLLAGLPPGIRWPTDLPVVDNCQPVRRTFQFHKTVRLSEFVGETGAKDGRAHVHIPLSDIREWLDLKGVDKAGLLPIRIVVKLVDFRGFPRYLRIPSFGINVGATVDSQFRNFTKLGHISSPAAAARASNLTTTASAAGKKTINTLVSVVSNASNYNKLADDLKEAKSIVADRKEMKDGTMDFSGYSVVPDFVKLFEHCSETLFFADRAAFAQHPSFRFLAPLTATDWDTIARNVVIKTKSDGDYVEISTEQTVPGTAKSLLFPLVLNELWTSLNVAVGEPIPEEKLKSIVKNKNGVLRIKKAFFDGIIEKYRNLYKSHEFMFHTTDSLTLQIVPRISGSLQAAYEQGQVGLTAFNERDPMVNATVSIEVLYLKVVSERDSPHTATDEEAAALLQKMGLSKEEEADESPEEKAQASGEEEDEPGETTEEEPETNSRKKSKTEDADVTTTDEDEADEAKDAEEDVEKGKTNGRPSNGRGTKPKLKKVSKVGKSGRRRDDDDDNGSEDSPSTSEESD